MVASRTYCALLTAESLKENIKLIEHRVDMQSTA